MEPVIHITIGMDLGQRRDPTAIAVVEMMHAPDGHAADRVAWEVRHLERLPLQTKYPAVADRLAEVQRNAGIAAQQAYFQRHGCSVRSVTLTTFIDATGAVPALDMFRERGLNVTPCFFTYGDRRTEQGGQVTIGKAWLVNRLQSLAQSDRLHLPPNHPEASAMMRELQDYEIKVDQNANDKYGAFKVGTHDDLVTALGLAVQLGPRTDLGALNAYLNRRRGGRR